MAFVAGKNAIFKIGNTSNSLTDISAYIDQVDGLPGTITTGDTTVLGVSAKQSIPLLKDAVKVSLSGKYD